MRAITPRHAGGTGDQPAAEPGGGRRIDITVHVELPASGEPGPRDPLRDMLARAVIFLMVLAATVVSVALASGAPGGGGIWAAISRLARLLSGG
jgi:hypothetical protein